MDSCLLLLEERKALRPFDRLRRAINYRLTTNQLTLPDAVAFVPEVIWFI